MCNILLLRGETFRTGFFKYNKKEEQFMNCKNIFKNQMLAFDSIIKHVIIPWAVKNIKVYIITHHNDYIKDVDIKNAIIEKFKPYNCVFLVKPKLRDQVLNFKQSINMIDSYDLNCCNGLMIVRSDLFFFQSIDYTRANKDVICFQWNLFIEKTQSLIADQIHFIGGNLVNKFKDLINNEKIDIKVPGTLHAMPIVFRKHFKLEQISYLNYIEDPHPDSKECRIRGNPSKELGNPLYNYTRFML